MPRERPGGAGRPLVLLGGLGLAVAVGMLVVPPIPQDPAFHAFADARRFLGIPSFTNVASNAGFLWVGAAGLRRLLGPGGGRGPFADPREARAYVVFFAAILLTGVGSAWYHLAPDNARLVWDRLPIAVAFMALVSAALAERVGVDWGVRALGPLVAAGALSVVQWHLTELAGRGDLRLYAAVQFGPLLLIPVLAWRRPSRYADGAGLVAALGLYVLAKLCEAADHAIFAVAGIGGHALKHLLAAAAAWWILLMLLRRRPGLASRALVQ